MMSDTSAAFPRDEAGRFKAGNPGRPKGSRNRMTNRLAMALLDDFSANEADNIERLRRWHFQQYVQLMGRFLPRVTNEARSDFSDYSAEETAMTAAAVREALERVERGEAGLDAVMAALERGPAAEAEAEAAPDPVDYGESAAARATADASTSCGESEPAAVDYGESAVAKPPGQPTADGGWLKLWGAPEA